MTWDDLFKPFENKFVIVNIDTDRFRVFNLIANLNEIRVTDDNGNPDTFVLDFGNGTAISINVDSTFEPYINAKNQLIFLDDDIESISLALYEEPRV